MVPVLIVESVCVRCAVKSSYKQEGKIKRLQAAAVDRLLLDCEYVSFLFFSNSMYEHIYDPGLFVSGSVDQSACCC